MRLGKCICKTRKRHGGGDTTCGICGIGVEDLGHFLLRCQKLEGKRRIDLLGNRGREDAEIIGELGNKVIITTIFREKDSRSKGNAR